MIWWKVVDGLWSRSHTGIMVKRRVRKLRSCRRLSPSFIYIYARRQSIFISDIFPLYTMYIGSDAHEAVQIAGAYSDLLPSSSSKHGIERPTYGRS